MRHRSPFRLVLLGIVAVALATGPVADAQTVPDQVPTQEIIPEPDAGHAPEEAGDRGGSLQLLVLVLVVAGIGGVAFHVTRQSRRARTATQPERIASQAVRPSTKPER